MRPDKAEVISDDTDVSMLLLHFVSTGDMKANLLMQPTSTDSDKVVDITATYYKNISIISDILTAQALSVYDTVGSYFGIRKPPVAKGLQNNTLEVASIGEFFYSNCVRQKGPILFISCQKQIKLIALWKQEGRFGNIIYLKITHQHQK